MYFFKIQVIFFAKEGQEQPLIISATIRDYIRQTGITHLLYLKISSSGGEAITEKRIFSSGHTAYIGGSTISYILAEKDGKVISESSEYFVYEDITD